MKHKYLGEVGAGEGMCRTFNLQLILKKTKAIGVSGIYDVLCKSARDPLVEYHLEAPPEWMVLLYSVDTAEVILTWAILLQWKV